VDDQIEQHAPAVGPLRVPAARPARSGAAARKTRHRGPAHVPRRDALAELRVLREEAEHVPHHEEHVLFGGDLDHRFCVGDGASHRLLAKNVQPGARRLDDGRPVQRRRQADEDRVGARHP
jgi:hypothetical protein